MACVLGLIMTPVCRILAFKLDFLDKPLDQDHKTHKKVTPLLGGLAICLAWLATITIGVFASRFIDTSNLSNIVIKNLKGISSVERDVIVICLGAVAIMLLGLFDDKYNMSAKVKLAFQFLIAFTVISWGGVKISFFIQNYYVSFAVTVFWILLVINAINFFDNMDGLAVGTATITLAFFAVAAAVNQQYYVSSFCAAGAGAALGFWFYNHSPASIFMGDSGSHFLGYLLAVSGAKVTFYNPEISVTRFPILIPLFILAIPLFDAFAVVVIRLIIKAPIYIGDNNHISHRFVKMGMSRKRAVFMVHLLTFVIGLSVLPLLWGEERTTIVSLIQAVTILGMVTFLQFSKQESST
jgi:UDP-GlcNAc:undecaprenyl-phosphate GlcNAc-1-phosphate transferase